MIKEELEVDFTYQTQFELINIDPRIYLAVEPEQSGLLNREAIEYVLKDNNDKICHIDPVELEAKFKSIMNEGILKRSDKRSFNRTKKWRNK